MNLFKHTGTGMVHGSCSQLTAYNTWACKYPVVLMQKCRRKLLHVQLRKNTGEIFWRPARQKERSLKNADLLNKLSLLAKSAASMWGYSALFPWLDMDSFFDILSKI